MVIHGNGRSAPGYHKTWADLAAKHDSIVLTPYFSKAGPGILKKNLPQSAANFALCDRQFQKGHNNKKCTGFWFKSGKEKPF